MNEAGESRARPGGAWLGWGLAGLLVVYTIFVHQGLAPATGGLAVGFWRPNGFPIGAEWLGGFMDRPLAGTVALVLIPLVLTAGIFVATGSAIARAIGCCSIVIVALLAFYGLSSSAFRVWEWFHWRGSAVIALTGLCVGSTLAAPVLAASWLKLRWAARLALYAPVGFAIASLIRNSTGTDEALPFNIAPWPATSALGLAIGSYALVGLMAGLSVGLILIASGGPRAGRRLAGFAAGALIPEIWFYAQFSYTPAPMLAIMLCVSAAALGALLVRRRGAGSAELMRRATHLAVGAALVALPLFAGRALAEGDYAVSRHVRARIIIDALTRYYADEGMYPDELVQLLDGSYLEVLPRPRVGFGIYYDLGWLEPVRFDYRGLGDSYVLEFFAAEWVMCAYNPPWSDLEEAELLEEEEDQPIDPVAAGATCRHECSEVCEYDCDEEDEDQLERCRADCAEICDERCAEQESAAEQDAGPGEAWSCPTDRPELW